MESKPFKFNGSGLGYIGVTLAMAVASFIPLFGWSWAFNFFNKWVADNSLVNDRKIVYSATYGESLKFNFVNGLLTIITFGIYGFWYAVKSYRFAYAHTGFADGAPLGPAPTATATPLAPTPPAAPQPPVVTPTPQPPTPPSTPVVMG